MKIQNFKERRNQRLPPRTGKHALCDNTKYQSSVYHKIAVIQLTFRTKQTEQIKKDLKAICSILHYYIHYSQNTCH